MDEQTGGPPVRRTGSEVPNPGATVAVADLHVRYQTSSTERTTRHPGQPRRRVLHRLLERNPQVQVRALSSVSFVARSGESIGVIGRNGSGKSTLLPHGSWPGSDPDPRFGSRAVDADSSWA